MHSTKLLLTFDYIIVIFDICKVNCWYFPKAKFLLSKRLATLRPNLNLHAIIEIYIFKLTMFVRSIFELGKCSWMFVDEFNNIKVEIYAAETHECFACEFLGRTCNAKSCARKCSKVVQQNWELKEHSIAKHSSWKAFMLCDYVCCLKEFCWIFHWLECRWLWTASGSAVWKTSSKIEDRNEETPIRSKTLNILAWAIHKTFHKINCFSILFESMKCILYHIQNTQRNAMQSNVMQISKGKITYFNGKIAEVDRKCSKLWIHEYHIWMLRIVRIHSFEA